MDSKLLNQAGTGQFILTNCLSRLARLSYQQFHFQTSNICLRSTTYNCSCFSSSSESIARTVPTFRCGLEHIQAVNRQCDLDQAPSFAWMLEAVVVMAQVPSLCCHKAYYRLPISTSVSKEDKVFLVLQEDWKN